MLPIWHEIPPIGIDAKYDQCQGSQNGWYDENDACPSEDVDAMVVVDAKEVHDDQDDGQQHADEAEREKELRCNEKGWKINSI